MESDHLEKAGEGSRGGKVIKESMDKSLRKALNMYGLNHPLTRELIAKGRGKDLKPRQRKGSGPAPDMDSRWNASHANMQDLKSKFAHHENKRDSHSSLKEMDANMGKPHEEKKYNKKAQPHAENARKYRKEYAQAKDDHRKLMDEKMSSQKDSPKPETQGASKEYSGADAMNRLYGHHGGVKKSATESLMEKLRKAGEGSKGGVVIGHTGSGKPIYRSSGSRGSKEFNAHDHQHAYIAHSHHIKALSNRKQKLGNNDGTISDKDRKKSHKMQKEMDHHRKQADQHQNKMEAHQTLGTKLQEYGQAMGKVKMAEGYGYDAKQDG